MGSKRNLNSTQINQIRDLADSNLTLQEIAEKVGVSTSTAWKYSPTERRGQQRGRSGRPAKPLCALGHSRVKGKYRWVCPTCEAARLARWEAVKKAWKIAREERSKRAMVMREEQENHRRRVAAAQARYDDWEGRLQERVSAITKFLTQGWTISETAAMLGLVGDEWWVSLIARGLTLRPADIDVVYPDNTRHLEDFLCDSST
jgi:transposase-like protein